MDTKPRRSQHDCFYFWKNVEGCQEKSDKDEAIAECDEDNVSNHVFFFKAIELPTSWLNFKMR